MLLADREGSARRALAGALTSINGVELAGEVGERTELDDALRITHSDVLVIDDRLLHDIEGLLAGGSRGRGAVTATVLGSVASGLVHAAALPVLVVRQPEVSP